MSGPQDEQSPDRVVTPTVSTAPTSGATPPSGTRWWHWEALPHHLGRARTSTVILSALFLAVFALYLNVRPDDPTRTSPAGGGSDVEAPVVPGLPAEPTTPEPTEEPAPTSDPEDTGTPTTDSTPTSTSPRTTEPTTGPDGPTGTSEPAETTGSTTDQETTAPSSPSSP